MPTDFGGNVSKPELFVIGTGQDDNIGDVVLRRELFDHVRSIGRLHIFVGDASPDFIEALRLGHGDVVYQSYREWTLAAWRQLTRNRVWYIEKPGQLKLDRQTLLRQIKALPLVLAIRLRRGQVLRLGIAVHTPDSEYLRYMRPLLKLSTSAYWRDTMTRSAFGFGLTSPDWAFAHSSTDDQLQLERRPNIAVSYRADRTPPSDVILEAIRRVARANGRRLVVVTQVRRDDAQSAYIASRLDAEHVDWPDTRSATAHEHIVREAYRESALVISDRLHALIIGMTEGAAPFCVSDRGESKVERHLDAAGFAGATVIADRGLASLESDIAAQLERIPEAIAAAQASRKVLVEVATSLATGRSRSR